MRAPRLAILAALAVALGGSIGDAAAPDADGTLRPVARSTTAGPRRALILRPGLLDGPTAARNAVARADASRYRELLRLLGFEVTTITGTTRLDLQLGVRTFAETATNADVAVFVLGTARAKDGALYIIPAGDEPQPEHYEMEGLRLGRLLEPIAGRGPKATVVLVDECRDGDDKACRAATAVLPDTISVIVGLRRAADASGEPRAGLASLGTEMVPLMQRDGLAYLDLFGELKQRLASTNMALAAGPSLTRDFAFLPAGFLGQLDELCNRVDPDASADALRQGAPVAALVPACEGATRIWSFSNHFKTRLDAAREEAAFQRAAGCDAAAMGAFLGIYGGSRLAPAVNAQRDACEAREREARERQAQEQADRERAERERADREREERERQARETPPPPPPAEEAGLTCTVGGLDPNGDNWLALRHGPSPQSAWSTTHMGPGTRVTALAQLGPWMRVRLASGEEGWASRHYLSCGGEAPIPPISAGGGTCVVAGLDPAGNNWLALREQPSFQSPWSSTQMGPGTPLTPLGRSGPWLHVRLRNGETGWANARFVRCEE